MNFNSTSRKLTSDTGYIKSRTTADCYTSPIYLGIYDDPENYISATQEEYEEWEKSQQSEESNIN